MDRAHCYTDNLQYNELWVAESGSVIITLIEYGIKLQVLLTLENTFWHFDDTSGNIRLFTD